MIIRNFLYALFFSIVVVSFTGCAESQASTADTIRAKVKEHNQNLYVIEREIPGAGNLTADELKGVSQVSCSVLEDLGSEIQWLHSYVTGDKVYCVYTAPNREMVLEHAKQGGFPANSVTKVERIIDPSTAD